MSPVAATLQGFFAAFLTGNGDLSRYLAEGVRGAPVSPAPFVTATVERMAVESVADDRLLVRAEVRATTRGGAQQLLGYELQARLSASGRWEIGHAAGAPSLVHDPADPAADADPDAGDVESGTTVSSVPGGAGTGGTPTSSTAPTTTADEPGM